MADLTSAARSATTHDRRWWWIPAALCLSLLLAAIDNTIVNVALPTLCRQIGSSTSDLPWVVDAETVASVSLLLVCRNIGDRLGRRRVLQVGLVLFALASLAGALSTTVDQLIAARAAMGACVALVYPAWGLVVLGGAAKQRPGAFSASRRPGCQNLAVFRL